MKPHTPRRASLTRWLQDTRPLAEKITKGKAKFEVLISEGYDFKRETTFITMGRGADSEIARILPTHLGQATNRKRADAELIVEAFNVTHETGCTPRHLAEERAELIASLRALCDSLLPQDMHNGNRSQYNAARELLARLTT